MDAKFAIVAGSRGKALLVFFLLVLFAGSGTSALASWHWADRFYPGISIGSISVSGKTQGEARAKIAALIEEALREDLKVELVSIRTSISLEDIATNDPDLSRTLITTDVETALQEAFAAGRFRSLAGPLGPAITVLTHPHIEVPILIDAEEISRRILEKFPQYDVPPSRTHYLIQKDADEHRAAIVEGRAQTVLDISPALASLEKQFSTLTFSDDPLILQTIVRAPRVTLEQALSYIPEVEALVSRAPFTIRSGEFLHTLAAEEIGALLLPEPEGLAVSSEGLDSLLQDIGASVAQEPQDARFEIEGTRVKTFVPSTPGISLALQESASALRAALTDGTRTEVTLPVVEVEPDVTLAEANNLGIDEILGVGTSNYKGSPGNRIKNIRNGARLLNGTLIAPDETFSLLAALRPFSTDNGYLPELVIKGNAIVPEIGGGLCQIGTTTFRATMHAGLPVNERRNHSLVVRYYNDPQNGNPGTDATIYEPAPDFKFHNDTGHYILFTTAMNEATQELAFTFWGTRDGRTGSYSAPTVEKWIPVGEPRYTDTASLPPGSVQCQSEHPGAVASFTYTIARPDGTKEETVYTSHYRALPKLCLRGIDPAAAIPPIEASPAPSEPPVPLAE